MLESTYQAKLIKRLKYMFPGCHVLKNDSSYQQGIPDLTIFWQDRWAALEVKRSAEEEPEPNQPWFIEQFNEMSFAAFIYPENEEEVLHDLQRAFQSERSARVS